MNLFKFVSKLRSHMSTLKFRKLAGAEIDQNGNYSGTQPHKHEYTSHTSSYKTGNTVKTLRKHPKNGVCYDIKPISCLMNMWSYGDTVLASGISRRSVEI